MSRVAKNPIKLPSGVDIKISGSDLSVKGPKGNLALILHPAISFDENDGEYMVKADGPKNLAMAGTFRALVSNMVTGVTTGFQKKLQLVGVGGFNFCGLNARFVVENFLGVGQTGTAEGQVHFRASLSAARHDETQCRRRGRCGSR